MALEVVSSTLTTHPIKKAFKLLKSLFSISFIGLSPSGKATDFDSVTRGFESRQPSHKHRFLKSVLFFLEC